MRWIALLATVGLAASAYWAPRARSDAGDPANRFVGGDPRALIAQGEAERALGVQLAGYDALTRDEAAADPADLRGRIRTGFRLSAIALGQEGLVQLVQLQTKTYLAQRARIDPDGSFLKEMMNEWIDLRLQHTGFYARASLAMFLATVNDPRGHEMMKGFSQKGPYFSQFFPFVRAHLVHWNAVEPMVRHYLETGDVEGKTEAGYTLLVYEAIFELGRDLLDKHEADIREAFLTIRRQLRAPDRRNPILLSVGTTAMQGLAMLALRGDKGVRTVLRKMRPVEVPFHVEPMRAARYVAGIKPYPRPTSNAFLNLPDSEQLYLWRGSHLRAAVFHRELASDARPEVADDFREAMKFVRASYQTNHFLLRGTALVVLNRVGTERDKEVIEQALAGGGIPSLYATCLLDPEDPVPTLLPAVGSMAAWTAALAAVTLAGVGENSALQR